MSSPQNAIIVDDDDGGGSSPGSQRSRSLSFISTSASSTTLCRKSEEPKDIPEIERLSVSLTREPQPYRNGVSENGANRERRRHNEKDARHRPQKMPNVHRQESQPYRNGIFENGATRKRRRSIDSDQDEGHNRNQNDTSFNRQSQRQVPPFNSAARELFDLEEDEDKAHTFNIQDYEVIDVDEIEARIEEELLQEERHHRGRKSQNVTARNPPVILPFIEIENFEIESFEWGKLFLKAKQTVELQNGDFLKVKAIIKNCATDDVFLRGWLLKRNNRLGGVVPPIVNEVTFILEKDLDDPRQIWEQSVLDVELKDFKKVRNLVCTNRLSPYARFDKRNLPYGRNEVANLRHAKANETLVARRKHITEFDNSQARFRHAIKPNDYLCFSNIRLTDDECSQGFADPLPPQVRRSNYRGETVLGGSYLQPWGATAYTYGDIFSGCGGAMRGALSAGLKPIFGVDNDPNPCETLRKNFPGVDVYEMAVNEFASMPDPDEACKPDITHISPVCTFYSRINTGINKRQRLGKGQKDEANEVTLFSIGSLLEKMKPRMVTVEQTFSIMSAKFRGHYNSMARMFIDNNFDIRCEKVKFQELGLPQNRDRLIIVGAGPGDTLPPRTRPTHSENGGNGLKPFTTPREVLRQIPLNAKNHDVAFASRKGNHQPWDDLKITNCITKNGGKHTGHPSGQRGLTPREFAALSGFPHRHGFYGNAIRGQIGNAYPPSIAEAQFRSIVKHLEKVDAAEKRRLAGH